MSVAPTVKPVTIPDELADDPRLHAGEPDGSLAVCRLPVADLHADRDGEPGPSVGTQLIRGERAHVLGEGPSGWLRVAGEHDRYVGWVRRVALDLETKRRPLPDFSHAVSVPRTFLYPAPDLAARPAVATLPLGARVLVRRTLEVRHTPYAVLDDGRSVVMRHLAKRGTHARDPVAIAEMLLHTPYLWGGRTALGIDCSGLVQLSHGLCGRRVLRDADMQERTIGEPVDTGFDGNGVPTAGLGRGDLVFWRGHCGMMTDERKLIHASGHSMTVSIESLADAVQRIRALYGDPTSVRRP